MKIIEENPFRILGVYANARPAEIVSNCDDMEAYISIGQTVSFDLDFNNLMPQVLRTADTVSNAKKQINLPKDKLKHALFWFIKDSSSIHALNYLKNGDLNSASSVFEIEESYSARVNQAVVAMMQNNWGIAIASITEMIHDEEGLGLREDFVKAICGDAFTIDEDELAHIYIDTLLEEMSASELIDLFQMHGTSTKDDDYLESKAVEEPIARINAEIVQAKSVKRDDASANYKAGKALMANTKSDLEKVKDLLGDSDMKYQMIADDLANTILQCGINYYNNSKEENSADKGLELQEYALSIAVGRLAKDRCQKNVSVLRKRKEQSVYEKDIEAIVKELKSFETATASLSRVCLFLNNCKPHIDVLKSKLGKDELYLKISSAIANNALSMIIEVVNRTDKKSTVEEARDIINTISAMDLDYQTRERVEKNAIIISRNIAMRPSGFGMLGRSLRNFIETIIGIVKAIFEVVFGVIGYVLINGLICGLFIGLLYLLGKLFV